MTLKANKHVGKRDWDNKPGSGRWRKRRLAKAMRQLAKGRGRERSMLRIAALANEKW